MYLQSFVNVHITCLQKISNTFKMMKGYKIFKFPVFCLKNFIYKTYLFHRERCASLQMRFFSHVLLLSRYET